MGSGSRDFAIWGLAFFRPEVSQQRNFHHAVHPEWVSPVKIPADF